MPRAEMSFAEGFGDPDDIDTYNKKTFAEIEEEKAAGTVDRRNHVLIERLLNEISGSGNVAHDTSHLTNRGDDAPIVSLDKRLFQLKADRILPKHKLFK